MLLASRKRDDRVTKRSFDRAEEIIRPGIDFESTRSFSLFFSLKRHSMDMDRKFFKREFDFCPFFPILSPILKS